jgi:hypothetical protein
VLSDCLIRELKGSRQNVVGDRDQCEEPHGDTAALRPWTMTSKRGAVLLIAWICFGGRQPVQVMPGQREVGRRYN